MTYTAKKRAENKLKREQAERDKEKHAATVLGEKYKE